MQNLKSKQRSKKRTTDARINERSHKRTHKPTHKSLSGTALTQFLTSYRARIERVLARALPSPKMTPQKLHAAQRYAVQNGGKRLRPLLVYAVGKALGATIPSQLTALDAVACGLELTHAFSLIHDDLPCIDNDDWRRGKPSCHKAFGEATALLAGDALQLLAIEVICNCKALGANAKVSIIKALTKACGSLGVIGGEFLDVELAQQQQRQQRQLQPQQRPCNLQSKSTSTSAKQLEKICLLKTGALLQACVRMAALTITQNEKILATLDKYARYLGIAFQIQDDVLEFEEEELKKENHNVDSNNRGDSKICLERGDRNNKAEPSYPQIIGIVAAKKRMENLYNQAQRALQTLANDLARKNKNARSNMDLLFALTNYIKQRNY